MTTLTIPRSRRRTAGTTPNVAGSAAWFIAVMAGAVGVGALFGMLSRIYDDSSAGWGELGSPWILFAFALGAVVARSARFSSARLGGSIATASVAGSAALVVAIAVNYRMGLGSVLPIGGLTHARGWGIAAMGAGIVFGGLGSIWGSDASTRSARWSATALASIITGEATLGIVRGQFMTAIDRGSLGLSTFHMYAAMSAVGLAISAAAAPAHRRLRVVAFTIALTFPTALFIDYFYASIY